MEVWSRHGCGLDLCGPRAVGRVPQREPVKRKPQVPNLPVVDVGEHHQIEINRFARWLDAEEPDDVDAVEAHRQHRPIGGFEGGFNHENRLVECPVHRPEESRDRILTAHLTGQPRSFQRRIGREQRRIGW